MIHRPWPVVLHRSSGLLLQGASDPDEADEEGVSPAQILRSCLIDLGLVCFPGQDSNLTPCFVGGMPNDPSPAVALYDGAGKLFGRGRKGVKNHVHPGVRLLIRTPDYTGFGYANRLAKATDRSMSPIVTQVPEDGSRHWIQSVTRTSDVVSLGEEPNTKAQKWTFNVRISFQDNEPSIG